MPNQSDEAEKVQPKPIPVKHEPRGLPLPRPEGQPELEDVTTGDEGGAGFYGPDHDKSKSGKS